MRLPRLLEGLQRPRDQRVAGAVVLLFRDVAEPRGLAKARDVRDGHAALDLVMLEELRSEQRASRAQHGVSRPTGLLLARVVGFRVGSVDGLPELVHKVRGENRGWPGIPRRGVSQGGLDQHAKAADVTAPSVGSPVAGGRAEGLDDFPEGWCRGDARGGGDGGEGLLISPGEGLAQQPLEPIGVRLRGASGVPEDLLPAELHLAVPVLRLFPVAVAFEDHGFGGLGIPCFRR